MKRLIPFILFATPLSAQWAVFDPTNFAVNTLIQSGQAANHLEILRQWAVQLEQLNRQYRAKGVTLVGVNVEPDTAAAVDWPSKVRARASSHCDRSC